MANILISPAIDIQIEQPNSIEIEIPNLRVTPTTVTNDYELLRNKPSINDVELIGNKTFDELGMSALSNVEILRILS